MAIAVSTHRLNRRQISSRPAPARRRGVAYPSHSARPVFSAHRGGGGDLLELLNRHVDWSSLGRLPDHYDHREEWSNRLRTIAEKWAQGQRVFEIDLAPTKEGRAAVTHHSDLRGAPTWDYDVVELKEMGWAELDAALDLLEGLQLQSGEKATVLLDLKGAYSSEVGTDAGENGVHPKTQGLVRYTIEVLQKRIKSGHWDYSQLQLASFNHGALAQAKLLDPKVWIALSFAKENLGLLETQMNAVRKRKDYRHLAYAMVNTAVGADAFAINVDGRLASRVLGRIADDRRVEVMAWSSYRIPENIPRLANAGVERIHSDTPEAARADYDNFRRKQLLRAAQLPGIAPQSAASLSRFLIRNKGRPL